MHNCCLSQLTKLVCMAFKNREVIIVDVFTRVVYSMGWIKQKKKKKKNRRRVEGEINKY